MKPCAPIAAAAFCLCALCLLAAGPLRAQTAAAPAWTLAASETLPAPAEGIEHHEQTIRGQNGETVTLHCLTFDSSRHTFRVLDQGSLGRDDLAEIMRHDHCLAGTNAGFFQPDFDPVGLVVSDGKTVHPLYHARLLSGVLMVTSHRIALRRSTRPLREKRLRQAVQSGPYLVESGQTLAGLNDARSARRTAVCTDGYRHWTLVSASAVTLAELGVILADSALLPGGRRIEAALNLDGGSSTCMWAQQPGKGEPFYLHEGGIVRDFVGIVPRPER